MSKGRGGVSPHAAARGTPRPSPDSHRPANSLGAHRYALYVMDYGAPVGYRLALKHPERVTALVVQNGNAYAEGMREFWKPIKAYWASGSAKNREALRQGTTLEDTGDEIALLMRDFLARRLAAAPDR